MSTTIPSATEKRSGSSRSSSISSSFALLSPPTTCDQSIDDNSDEQIVWCGSNDSLVVPKSGSQIPTSRDDDDFVVLSPPTRNRACTHVVPKASPTSSSVSAAPSVESLVTSTKKLRVESRSNSPSSLSTESLSKARRKKRRAHRSPPASPPKAPVKQDGSPPAHKPITSASVKAKSSLKETNVSKQPGHHQKKSSVTSIIKPQTVVQAPLLKEECIGFGERPVVDDVSECGFEQTLYEHASELIASLLSASDPGFTPSRLEIIQALLIELGLVTSQDNLPTSLTSARALLRSHAHLNIRDYLAVREKGQEALRQIMHKNRASLVRELRKKRKNRAPLGWVKDSGLSVLLVQCY